MQGRLCVTSTKSATWQDFIRQLGRISFGNLAVMSIMNELGGERRCLIEETMIILEARPYTLSPRNHQVSGAECSPDEATVNQCHGLFNGESNFFRFFSKKRFALTLYDSIAWYINLRKIKTDDTESRRFRSETSQQATAEVL